MLMESEWDEREIMPNKKIFMTGEEFGTI